MERKIEINLDEALQAFLLTEELVKLLHQPGNYNSVSLEDFAIKQNGYKRLADLYYNVLWNWLPDDVKQSLEDR